MEAEREDVPEEDDQVTAHTGLHPRNVLLFAIHLLSSGFFLNDFNFLIKWQHIITAAVLWN